LPAWAEAACVEYAKRMPKGYEVRRVAVKRESELPFEKNQRIVVLDERGEDYSTGQFAKLLSSETAFVIGGADGLSEATRSKAHIQLRLSAFTLPHALAQVVLLEQIYRAATILTGHPYHRV
jgi:23S rRNA (pseudouridine1915-N3)-methyltransferase